MITPPSCSGESLINICSNNSLEISEFKVIAFSAYWSSEICCSIVITAPTLLDAILNTASTIASLVAWVVEMTNVLFDSLLLKNSIDFLSSGASKITAIITNDVAITP